MFALPPFSHPLAFRLEGSSRKRGLRCRQVGTVEVAFILGRAVLNDAATTMTVGVGIVTAVTDTAAEAEATAEIATAAENARTVIDTTPTAVEIGTEAEIEVDAMGAAPRPRRRTITRCAFVLLLSR